eukprot:8672532-Pyramimonas_sp.AAC.1
MPEFKFPAQSRLRHRRRGPRSAASIARRSGRKSLRLNSDFSSCRNPDFSNQLNSDFSSCLNPEIPEFSKRLTPEGLSATILERKSASYFRQIPLHECLFKSDENE